LVASRMRINKKALTWWANVKFDTSILEMTIGRILKKKDTLTTFDVGRLANSKPVRTVQCPEAKQTTFS
jgi:hypothetical protein